MIESHRDEDLCRRWDALADEFHTHHLTTQEYSYDKSKWWLHSNKQGSDTMPLRHRPDFKQALSTLQRLQQEAGEESQVPAHSNKHQQWDARSSSSTWWNWQGSWWTPYHSESQDGEAPSVGERRDLLIAVFGKILRDKTFMNSIYFVTDGSFTADGGLL